MFHAMRLGLSHAEALDATPGEILDLVACDQIFIGAATQTKKARMEDVLNMD